MNMMKVTLKAIYYAGMCGLLNPTLSHSASNTVLRNATDAFNEKF
jgi:hypothetical protein